MSEQIFISYQRNYTSMKLRFVVNILWTFILSQFFGTVSFFSDEANITVITVNMSVGH